MERQELFEHLFGTIRDRHPTVRWSTFLVKPFYAQEITDVESVSIAFELMRGVVYCHPAAQQHRELHVVDSMGVLAQPEASVSCSLSLSAEYSWVGVLDECVSRVVAAQWPSCSLCNMSVEI